MLLIRRATAASAAAGRRTPASALLLLPASPSVARRRAAVAAAALPRQTRRGLASAAEEGVPAEPGIPAEPGTAPVPDATGSAPKSLVRRIKTDRKEPPPPVPAPRKPAAPRSIARVTALRRALGDGQRLLDAAAAEDTSEPGLASAALLQGRLTAASYDAASGTVALGYDGLAAPVHAPTLWLRDRCACARCVTPSSGQKQFQTSELPAFPAIESVDVVAVEGEGEGAEGEGAESETALRVVWAADEGATDGDATPHVATFPGQALLLELAHLDAPVVPALPPRRLWDRALLAQALRPVAFDAWMADGAAFDRALLDLYQLGLVIVEGVPETVADRPAVRAVAERIGNIQNTFYGETFDVVSKPAAENVAYTSEFLCLHQDLLYMNDPPYIQLLHCLRNDSAGGESLFSDSLAAAVHLQRHHPDHVDVLASYPVRYHYERNGHFYFGARPLLELAHAGRADPVAAGRAATAVIQHTAWSPPFQQAFPGHPVPPVRAAASAAVAPPGDTPDTPDAAPDTPDKRRRTRLHRWHAGAAVFQQLVEHPDNLFEMRLRPGQCVLFNNRRVLHGRRQFAPATGARHLQGTYIDEQTFTSRVIGLVRAGRVPAAAWGPDARGHTTRQRPIPLMETQVAAAEQEQVEALLAARAARAAPEPQPDDV